MGISFKGIGEKVGSLAASAAFKLKECSPELLLGVGILAMGGAVVAGIKAARHHDDIMDDHEKRMQAAKAEYVVREVVKTEEGDIANDILVDNEEDLEELRASMNLNIEGMEVIHRSQKEINKAVRKEYCRTAARLCRLYWRTGALMVISTACFIGMHNIQASRAAAFSTAYTSVREAFDAYQKNNIELNGEENHRMCKYGWHEEEIEATDSEGNKTTIKKKVANTAEDFKNEEGEFDISKMPFHDNQYEFNRNTSRYYDGRANSDLATLKIAQSNFIDTYYINGFATVAQALQELGMDGVIKENPNTLWEGWVRGYGPDPDFGFLDGFNQRFLSGHNEQSVLLDFNVHGNVAQMLRDKENLRMYKNLERAEKLAAKEADAEV